MIEVLVRCGIGGHGQEVGSIRVADGNVDIIHREAYGAEAFDVVARASGEEEARWLLQQKKLISSVGAGVVFDDVPDSEWLTIGFLCPRHGEVHLTVGEARGALNRRRPAIAVRIFDA